MDMEYKLLIDGKWVAGGPALEVRNKYTDEVISSVATARQEDVEDAVAAGEGYFGFWTRRPVGVIAAISPFNFPLNLVAHKVAPALAAGNSVVLRPTTEAPLIALKLAE